MDRVFFKAHGVMQRDGESDKAFSAFCAFLQLPRDVRSIRRLADETDISKNSAGRWSRQHEWVARSQVFDSHVTDVLLQKLLDRRLHEVLSSIESSIDDSKEFREHTMRLLPGVRESQELLSLQQARIDNDDWQMQIMTVIHEIGRANAETETA